MGRVVGFEPKSDDLGHQILKSDFIPSDFAKSVCTSRAIFFSDRKIKIRSSESDRIINGLITHHDELFFGFVQPQPHQKPISEKNEALKNKN